MTTLDFTSALYLGLRHPSGSLRPWERLSAGTPAALTGPPGGARLLAELARLSGCEAATMATSTLHLFWDLFAVLGRRGNVSIQIDSEAYPVARWGVERMACRGLPVESVRHHDPGAFARAAAAASRSGRRPVLVTDGFCAACGAAAPLAAYLATAREFDGLLVVDDTQALGVLGSDPGASPPYGHGGGGSLSWHRIVGPEIILGASLAKGFGAPVAVLAGASALIARFEAESETAVQCSPPSIANLRAAERAMAINQGDGERLRRRLGRLVARFRARLAELGLMCSGSLFPVQTLAPSPALDPVQLHGRLLQRGVRAVLTAPRTGGPPQLSFLITAAHRRAELDRAVETLAQALAQPQARPWPAHEFELETPTSGRTRRTTPLTHVPPPLTVGPFPSAYMITFDLGDGRLKACVDALTRNDTPHIRATDPTLAGAAQLSAAVVDLTDPKKPVYAGQNDDDTFYVGSLAKIAPLYAAFELRVRVQRAVNEYRAAGHPTTGPHWQLPLVAALERDWGPVVKSAVPQLPPRVPALPSSFPALTTIFDFLPNAHPGTEVRFKPSPHHVDLTTDCETRSPDGLGFADWLYLMVRCSNNMAADRLIRALGYCYINGALEKGGFFTPAAPTRTALAGTGIWVSGSYDGHDWRQGWDPMALSMRGTAHYMPTTNFVANARQVAHLLTLAARGDLFGGDTLGQAACAELVSLMSTKQPGLVDFIEATLNPHGTENMSVSGKIGIGKPSPRSGRAGVHDCAVVTRVTTSGTLRYVSVGLGGLNPPSPRGDHVPPASINRLWFELDQCVQNAH
jgi:8-amino-7-oxononanoate synthase